ncbi:MAG: aminomethyl-transferring glycine dehydrogenase subunit GcvPA [Clostridium sp.]|nr:aminomethyl-transferring glycine dehydrogenase subunit GcvPA [Clostridium sp.]
MNHPYIPHTEADIQRMLDRIGLKTVDELYADVPESVVFRGDYDLPPALSETEIRRLFEELGNRNRRLTVFAGCGAYDHYAPAVIPYLIERSEFLTAYTPYQPEVAQGTLRYIFEYQSLICELTGMECSNASMYDGPTSAAESMFMALAATKKKTRVLISGTLLPQVREVMHTYAKYRGVTLHTLPATGGTTDLEALHKELEADDVAAVLIPSVNRYGIIEDCTGVAEAVHARKALLMMYADPSALAVVRTPGEWGADIVCGEAQSLGLPLHFGGPYLGFLACRKELVRKLPGRIVGATTDEEGKRAFVLTLQAREQHIRREKANSNICSNQSLMALYVTVYLSLMGKQGLKEVNELSYGGAHHLHDRLLETGLFEPAFPLPFLKEFVLKSKIPAERVHQALLEAGILGAVPTEEGLASFCVTEQRTPADIDRLVAVINTLKP